MSHIFIFKECFRILALQQWTIVFWPGYNSITTSVRSTNIRVSNGTMTSAGSALNRMSYRFIFMYAIWLYLSTCWMMRHLSKSATKSRYTWLFFNYVQERYILIGSHSIRTWFIVNRNKYNFSYINRRITKCFVSPLRLLCETFGGLILHLCLKPSCQKWYPIIIWVFDIEMKQWVSMSIISLEVYKTVTFVSDLE